MKKTFLFRAYSVNTMTLTEMTLNRKGSAMTTETLHFLKALYANETRQVWVFDETNTCIWKNDISKPLQSEADCQALLKTVAANTSSQLFWHESLLYAAEVQQSTELHCTILKITTEPVLTNVMKEKISGQFVKNFSPINERQFFRFPPLRNRSMMKWNPTTLATWNRRRFSPI